MSISRLVLGADGGGTKTLGLIADQDGVIRAREQVGATNPNVVGNDAAADAIVELIARCCQSAGTTPSGLASIVLGLAGAGALEQRKRLIDAVRTRTQRQGIPDLPLFIETDARVALEGAFDGGSGIVIIAGTGSVVIGKTATGEAIRVGGWGRVIGDEGSGYFLGVQGLKALARDLDGTAPAEWLKRECETRLGWRTREQIVLAVYQENFTIPSLAPIILDGGSAGDPVCLRILQQGAEELAIQAETALRLARQPNAGIVFFGGLIDHDTAYRRILEQALHVKTPAAVVSAALHPPAHGAVLMALERLKEIAS